MRNFGSELFIQSLRKNLVFFLQVSTTGEVWATLAEAGRPVARYKELWLFDSSSATQRKWLRSKRMLKLKAKGGQQQTLGDCGIGARARCTEPEEDGRCLEHNAID